MSGQDEKPFDIPQRLIWQAWKRVAANDGAPGADGVTIEDFRKDLGSNPYKIWNRMSGLGNPADIDAFSQKITHLEQQAIDLRLQLEQRDEDLAAARAPNRELMTQFNHAAPRP